MLQPTLPAISWSSLSPPCVVPENTARVVELAHKYKARKWIVGVDIAGDELQPMREEFVLGFRKARELGLHVTAHAAESGPAENVKEAVERLGAERIGHGYHVIGNDDVYSFAKKKKLHFEVSHSVMASIKPLPPQINDIRKHSG